MQLVPLPHLLQLQFLRSVAANDKMHNGVPHTHERYDPHQQIDTFPIHKSREDDNVDRVGGVAQARVGGEFGGVYGVGYGGDEGRMEGGSEGEVFSAGIGDADDVVDVAEGHLEDLEGCWVVGVGWGVGMYLGSVGGE